MPTDMLSHYFHLPEKEAARAFNLCLTSFKKMCRESGLPRWPYRKVRHLPLDCSNDCDTRVYDCGSLQYKSLEQKLNDVANDTRIGSSAKSLSRLNKKRAALEADLERLANASSRTIMPRGADYPPPTGQSRSILDSSTDQFNQFVLSAGPKRRRTDDGGSSHSGVSDHSSEESRGSSASTVRIGGIEGTSNSACQSQASRSSLTVSPYYLH